MITSVHKAAVGYSHSKLILAGEHAVVYGKPAIAIPFPLKVKSTIEEISGEMMIFCNLYSGPLNRMPVKLQGIVQCIKATLKELNKPFYGLLIRLHSSIPLGRGLGSSAAIAIAIVRSLFSFYGKGISHEGLMALVKISEIYAHGNPSGIDMAAASSEFPIWFNSEQEAIPFKVGWQLHIVVADSGRIGDTHAAVKKVRENFLLEPNKMQKTLERIENITIEAKRALVEGDSYLLGELLSLNHEELITLGVSDNGLNRLVEAAQSAGGLGAKLTGGGLGGCVLALASNPEHAKLMSDALVKAGANKTWYFSTDHGQQ